jgi:hypothetical protein
MRRIGRRGLCVSCIIGAIYVVALMNGIADGIQKNRKNVDLVESRCCPSHSVVTALEDDCLLRSGLCKVPSAILGLRICIGGLSCRFRGWAFGDRVVRSRFCVWVSFICRVTVRRHVHSREESSDTRCNYLTQLRLSRLGVR